jgi:hypothetical protein
METDGSRSPHRTPGGEVGALFTRSPSPQTRRRSWTRHGTRWQYSSSQNTRRRGRCTVHQESFTPDQEEELDQTWNQMAVELLTEHQEER